MKTSQLDQALSALKHGDVVAVPTETVYGLGALMSDERAVNRVFEVKNRPKTHPLIVHIAEQDWLDRYARSIPPYVRTLVEAFWPGPLTLILKKSDAVSPLITGGQETVAIRMPKHPQTLALIKSLNEGIVAPSANAYMELSPTQPEHVEKSLGKEVLVFDGGECSVGIESTIVDATAETEVRILRPGAITRVHLEKVLDPLNISVRYPESNEARPKVSGSCEKHYAPRKPLFLVSSKKLLAERLLQLAKVYGETVGIYFLAFGQAPELNDLYQKLPGYFIYHPMATDPDLYAKALYGALHEADNAPVEVILLETPPETEIWKAVWDRLHRAAMF